MHIGCSGSVTTGRTRKNRSSMDRWSNCHGAVGDQGVDNYVQVHEDGCEFEEFVNPAAGSGESMLRPERPIELAGESR